MASLKLLILTKGANIYNAYIERFWRTVKYEWLKLKYIPTVAKLKIELKNFMQWYNSERGHQSLEYLTPDEKACGFMDKFHNLPTTPQLLQQAN